MASKKITEFTTSLDVSLGDLIPFASDPAGTPATKAIKVEDLIGTTLTEVVSTRASAVTDKGKRLRSEGASAVNYTITNGVHAAGDSIDLCMGGTGVLTLIAGANVTVNLAAGASLVFAQHIQSTLICESTGATDVFTLKTGSGGGGGVEEAPEDGTPYARQDAGWVSAFSDSPTDTTSGAVADAGTLSITSATTVALGETIHLEVEVATRTSTTIDRARYLITASRQAATALAIESVEEIEAFTDPGFTLTASIAGAGSDQVVTEFNNDTGTATTNSILQTWETVEATP